MEGPAGPPGGVPLDVFYRGEGEGGGRPAPRGPGGFGVSIGGGPNFTVGLPTVQRPPSATDFNLFSTQTARTAINTPSAFPNVVQIPPNNVAVIRSISILANNLLVTSDLVWTLRFNQAAVPGWNALTINPRAAGSVEVSWTPDETYIPVPEGASIDVNFLVRDAGTYQVSVSVHGWFYSTSLAGLAALAY